jgi:hypothetical protein
MVGLYLCFVLISLEQAEASEQLYFHSVLIALVGGLWFGVEE